MSKEISHLHIKLSSKLKEDFRAMCDEDEIDMSDKVREIIANLVRNRKRQASKGGKEGE
jgi:antitoxin component of RelBE/YafQ-DinJ toxin-antitoxin module